MSERFWNWARRRQRIRDAGILIIWLNAIVAAWLLLDLVILELTGIVDSSGASSTGVARESLTFVGLHAVQMWMGWMIMRGRRFAIWVGTIIASAALISALLLSAGFIESFGGVYKDLLTRILVFALLSPMLVVQLAACVVALIADHAERKRKAA